MLGWSLSSISYSMTIADASRPPCLISLQALSSLCSLLFESQLRPGLTEPLPQDTASHRLARGHLILRIVCFRIS